MIERPALAELACEDCVPLLHVSRGRGVAGPVLVAAVEHQASCPWIARVAPEGATMAGPHGVLLHYRTGDTAEPPEGVGGAE